MWPKQAINVGDTWEFGGNDFPRQKVQIRAIVDETQIVIRYWLEPTEYSSRPIPRWIYKIEYPYFFSFRENSGYVVRISPSDDEADRVGNDL